jgi:NADPH-dependent 2,4-dienoyl-CoA reductase/sulfur reductase-like enzyme
MLNHDRELQKLTFHFIFSIFQRHYYQPLFTLIGGGIKKFPKSHRPMGSVLPKKAKWIQDGAAQFDPKNNAVYTAKGDKIEYDYLLIGVGLRLDYDKVMLFAKKRVKTAYLISI